MMPEIKVLSLLWWCPLCCKNRSQAKQRSLHAHVAAPSTPCLANSSPFSTGRGHAFDVLKWLTSVSRRVAHDNMCTAVQSGVSCSRCRESC